MPTSRAFEKLFRPPAFAPWRQTVLDQLPDIVGADPNAAFAARFDSFAATVQNRIDSDGSGPLTLTGSLDAQVQRALSQALRRGNSAPLPGGTAPGPGRAAVARTYASPTASWYGNPAPSGYPNPTTTTYSGAGSVAVAAPSMPTPAPPLTGLPPDQQVLVNEALVTQADLLMSLDALQSLSTLADPGDITAYKNVIRAEVMTLTQEFARPDLPRPALVRVLLGGLLGWSFPADRAVVLGQPPQTDGTPTGDVEALLHLVNLGAPVVPSAFVDQQLAMQGVVRADAVRLLQLWSAYQFVNNQVPPIWPGVDRRLAGIGGSAAVGVNAPAGVITDSRTLHVPTGTFSQRLITANLLLPVISQDAARVAGALDAIGFGPGPQETTPINGLQSAVDVDLDSHGVAFDFEPVLQAQAPVDGPGPTIKDILDWAADLSGGGSRDLIGQAGQLGLNLIADEADELFFIVIAVLTDLPDPFDDTQTQIELRSLARDLNELANQGI
jgi:hypothetical protein